MSREFMAALEHLFVNTEQLVYELRLVGRPGQMTTLQYNILEYLYYCREATLTDLSRCLYLSMPNASREVKKLHQAGLVAKQTAATDQRQVRLHLSVDGKRLMEEARERMTARADQLFTGLGEREQSEVVQLVGRMGTILGWTGPGPGETE